MAVTDESLGKALSAIFQKLASQPRATSVPPLGASTSPRRLAIEAQTKKRSIFASSNVPPEAPARHANTSTSHARAEPAAGPTTTSRSTSNQPAAKPAVPAEKVKAHPPQALPPLQRTTGRASKAKQDEAAAATTSSTVVGVVANLSATRQRSSHQDAAEAAHNRLRSPLLGPGGRLLSSLPTGDVIMCSHGPGRFHSSFCTMCLAQAEAAIEVRRERFLSIEGTRRDAVCEQEYVEMLSLRDAWAELQQTRRRLEREAVPRPSYADYYNAQRLRQMSSAVSKDERAARRVLVTEYEVGLDEIAAYHKLCVRQWHQLRDMRDRAAHRAQEAVSEEASRAESERASNAARATARERLQLEKSEEAERGHIDVCAKSVAAAIFDVFAQHRDALTSHEMRVHAMMQRHQHRLVSLAADLDRMAQDEAAARERILGPERKAFEVAVCMEPELRRRALAAATIRMRRELRERQDEEQLEENARALLVAEKCAAWQELDEAVAAARMIVDAIDRRHQQLRERRAWRTHREGDECSQALAADNEAWRAVRWGFECAIVCVPAIEEAKERRALADQKAAEKLMLVNFAREQRRAAQSEVRKRSELARDQTMGREGIMEELARCESRYILGWSEATTRRGIIDEMEAVFADEITNFWNQSKATATSLNANPRSRTDRCYGSPAAGYVLWLKQSVLSWFFGCDGVAILEGSSLKDPKGATVTEVSNVPVRAEVLNPCAGEDILLSHTNDAESEPHFFQTKYTGPIATLFDSLKFMSKGTYGRVKQLPRLIKVSIGEIDVILQVNTLPPLVSNPESYLSFGVVAPLKLFNAPSSSRFRMVRLVLTVPPRVAKHARLEFTVPDDFNVHPKQGITRDGKVVMRINQQLPDKLDVEFENVPTSPFKALLAAVLLRREEDLTPMEPLTLELVLTHKDDTLVHAVQMLDLEWCDQDIPRLKIISPEIVLRATCPADTPERMLSHLSDNAHHIFSHSHLTFPEDQHDVLGGTVRLSLGDWDGRAFFTIRPFGFWNRISVDPTVGILMCLNRACERDDGRDADIEIGTVEGFETHEMVIRFDPSVGVGTDIITSVLRSICVDTNRRGMPAAAQGSAGTAIVVAPSVTPASRHGSVVSLGHLAASPSGLLATPSPTMSTRPSFSGRPVASEGSLGTPALSPMGASTGITAWAATGAGGLTPTPTSLSVPNATTTTTTTTRRTTMVIRFGMDVNMTALGETIKGDIKLVVLPALADVANKALNNTFTYREGSKWRPFPAVEIKSGASFAPEARVEVQMVEGFEDTDQFDLLDKELDPVEKNWVFKHKGVPIAWVPHESLLHESPSNVFVAYLSGDLGIRDWMRESVTDPYPPENWIPQKSEITASGVNALLRNIVYQASTQVPTILNKVMLVTIDDGVTGRCTVPFDLRIEAVDNPTTITLGSSDLVYRQMSLTSRAGFPLLLGVTLQDPDSDNFHGGYVSVEHSLPGGDVGDTLLLLTRTQQEALLYQARGSFSGSCMATLFDLDDVNSTDFPFLSMVVDEQPKRLMEVVENGVYFAGEQIGTVVFKNNGLKDAPTLCIRINFFAPESKMVSFSTAEYVMQCFAYENTSSKLREGARTYITRLNCTGLKSTVETVVRLQVTAFAALIFAPAFSLQMRFEEGSKPKQLLRSVTSAIPNGAVLQNTGFLRALVVDSPDEADEITLDPLEVLKIKDQSIFVGKEVIATIRPRENKAEIDIAFVKMANHHLLAVLKSLVFSNRSSSINTTDRVIQIHCTTATEVEMCTLVVNLSVTSKDNPTDIKFAEARVVHMSGAAPTCVAPNTTVTDEDTSVFPKGSLLEVSIQGKQVSGELITLQSTPRVEVTIVNDAAHLRSQGVAIGFVAKGAARIDSETAFRKPFAIELMEASLQTLESIFATIAYSNASKTDRGRGKFLNFVLRVPGVRPVKAAVLVEIAPPVLDLSLNSSLLSVVASTPTPVAPSGRTFLATGANFYELGVAFVTGADDNDDLSIRFPADSGFALGTDGVITAPNAADRSKKIAIAKVLTQTKGQLVMRFEQPVGATVQIALRAIHVSVAATTTAKEVCVELTAGCAYGHMRELMHVRTL